MTTETQQIIDELKSIKEELTYIKEHMIDVDAILSKKEEAMVKEDIKEYKEGKGKTLEEFEKEMENQDA